MNAPEHIALVKLKSVMNVKNSLCYHFQGTYQVLWIWLHFEMCFRSQMIHALNVVIDGLAFINIIIY